MPIRLSSCLMSQKNNPQLSVPIMTIKASITHLLHALIINSNRWSNDNKWIVHQTINLVTY